MVSVKGRKKSEIFVVASIVLMLAVSGCLPVRHTPLVTGITLKPGRYLTSYYQAPDFNPAATSFQLEPFVVDKITGTAPQTFLPLFQQEVAQALEANGLKLTDTDSTCRLSGTIRRLRVSGLGLRFLLGRISAHLEVAGAIIQGDQTLAAFEDRLSLSSPLNPGPPAPKEVEIILRRVAREFAHHLLTEMLLPPARADSG